MWQRTGEEKERERRCGLSAFWLPLLTVWQDVGHRKGVLHTLTAYTSLLSCPRGLTTLPDPHQLRRKRGGDVDEYCFSRMYGRVEPLSKPLSTSEASPLGIRDPS